MRAEYSCCIAWSQLGSEIACFTLLGSQWVRRRVGLILGWTMPDFDLVRIGWVLVLVVGKDEWARVVYSECSIEVDAALETLGIEISAECPVVSTLVSPLPPVVPPLEGKLLSELWISAETERSIGIALESIADWEGTECSPEVELSTERLGEGVGEEETKGIDWRLQWVDDDKVLQETEEDPNKSVRRKALL